MKHTPGLLTEADQPAGHCPRAVGFGCSDEMDSISAPAARGSCHHHWTAPLSRATDISVECMYASAEAVTTWLHVEDTRLDPDTSVDINAWRRPSASIVAPAASRSRDALPVTELPGPVAVPRSTAVAAVDEELINKLNMSVMDLDLTVRANNCLETAQVETVAELVVRDEASLLAVRSFGKTSLREVKKKLEDLGLSLGMQLPEGYQAPESTSAPH